MAPRAASKEDHGAGDIFGATEAAVGVLPGHCVGAAILLHEPGGHFGGEEAGGDAVAEDVAGAELDGEVAG